MKKIFWIICIMFTLLFVPSQNTIIATSKSQESVISNAITTTDETPSEGEDTDDKAVEERIYEDLKKGGYEINNTSDISDKNFYSALLQIAREYIKTNYDGYIYTDSTIYNTMFKNIENITIKSMDIESIAGIEKIHFTKLKKLEIIDNKLTEIKSDYFVRMPALVELNLSNNKISSCDLTSKDINKLKVINLFNNKLTSIDLSKQTSVDLDIDLSNNLFSSITNISLPTRCTSIKLNIINNNIMDITNDYFEYSVLSMNIGVQGVVGASEDVTINTSNVIKIYKTNMLNTSIKIYKITNISTTLVQTITDADIDGVVLEKTFPVGEYSFEYFYNDAPMYTDLTKIEMSGYTPHTIKVIPSPVVFKYEFKGKIYDDFSNKVTGKVKVILSCEEGGKILYRLGSGEWAEGNEIMCDKGGNYSISAKVVIDGVESEEKSTLVRTSLNTIVPDILMLILILLFTLGLFFIVVPLVSKKWFRK